MTRPPLFMQSLAGAACAAAGWYLGGLLPWAWAHVRWDHATPGRTLGIVVMVFAGQYAFNLAWRRHRRRRRVSP